VGSKKEVNKLRSLNNIVIAPANTGKEISKRILVIKTHQINKFIENIHIPLVFMVKIVVIKLIAPNREEIPAI